ncbi:hypothetical protein, unlikely [Trypanosoma brucei gambiense DAL972]|uniref:Uncharacterized protein n=1 Tax=Trypanosoma brucei gambiense (strain MHOM/CI/86/DAL972) TaxID=679716 RepID=D0A3X8_TRYB9|nr:hypothetical protein, unlikely [Trypanosoma brucei gambiense DAL972]CBH15972.1 hypothetical protein, unlikely [Trypanosoma brucei gambiense DAL972]|eukprot:XP_011778236.1 hypothetical protein, unlikely [Trypanosoma brucei gambiense DAL972]
MQHVHLPKKKKEKKYVSLSFLQRYTTKVPTYPTNSTYCLTTPAWPEVIPPLRMVYIQATASGRVESKRKPEQAIVWQRKSSKVGNKTKQHQSQSSMTFKLRR